MSESDVSPVAAEGAQASQAALLATEQSVSASSKPAEPGSWVDVLPEDLRGRVAKFGGVEDLARAYANLEGLMGADPSVLVKITEDVKKNPVSVLARLGAPEKPDGYNINVDGLPQAAASKEAVDAFKSIAAQARLLPAQAEAVYRATAALVAQQEQAAIQRQEELVSALREELGPQFDDTVRNAVLAANKIGIREALIEAGLGSHPAVIKALAQVGRLMGEGNQPGAQAAARMTPEQALERARELMRKQYDAVRENRKEEAERLQREVAELYRLAS